MTTGCPEEDRNSGFTSGGTFTGTTGQEPSTDTALDGGDGTSSAGDTGADDSGDDATGAADDSADDTGGTTGEDVNVCGDGILGSMETCDGDLFGGLTCQSEGWESGDLACDEDCRYSTDGCYTCGNGVIEGPETCEGDTGNATCENQGFTEGEVTCNVTTCELDTSACTLCGDDAIEGDEDCEGANLASQDCESLGFLMGTLACKEDCQWDTAACIADDYTDDFESGSLSSDYTTSGNGTWVVNGTTPIAGSFSAHSPPMTDLQSASFEILLEYPNDGTISFSHKEDTESCCDDLNFYMDNQLQGSWAGTTTATMHMNNVTAGPHTFRWEYSKDISLSDGTDRVWVDDILAAGGRIPP